jgi:hypothetical protein
MLEPVRPEAGYEYEYPLLTSTHVEEYLRGSNEGV